MNKKILAVVAGLKSKGDYGTANAIADAVTVTMRVKAMLKHAEKEIAARSYRDEELDNQYLVDVLKEILGE